MSWFEDLTGFVEENPAHVRSRLFVEGSRLVSRVNDESFQIGRLDLPSLDELRARANDGASPKGVLKLSLAQGDVGRMHACETYRGTLFQVASQFNMLEMVSPDATPEAGVAIYEHDHTQGPACAIAAGAATIFRNYFVPLGDGVGQSADRQLDGLADVGAMLSRALDAPVASLWTMRNGYALCSETGLERISRYLARAGETEKDRLRGALRVGLHSDVEVTGFPVDEPNIVSQIFCSALPVAYSHVAADAWERFARLVLEAAYEATLWAGVLNARRGGSNIVALTLLGGGAFGNDKKWIFSALRRAVDLAREQPLDVRIVSYGTPSPSLREFVENFPG